MEVHAHYRNEHVRDWAKQNGVHVTAYSPLSSPALVKDMGMDFPELLKVRHYPLMSNHAFLMRLALSSLH